jgi:ABC-type multidrug transport system ATPase subunit
MSLRVRVRDEEWVVDGPVILGRGLEAEIRCLDPWISRRHAVLRPGQDGSGWELEDLDSAQGVWRGEERVRRVAISAVTHLTLGGPEGTPLTLEPLGPALLRIGRAMDNDVTISDLTVSRHHAELAREAAGWVLRDLGSSGGVFVDGHRIDEARITGQEVIGIGGRSFRLRDGVLVDWTPPARAALEAIGLTVRTPRGAVLLDDVGFAVPEPCLLAIVGPSGAGKSTLLRVLTGQQQVWRGQVHYEGRDLLRAYDDLGQRIGFVPQEDILHPQLSVRRALRYGAELRFGADVSAAERNARVDEVIAELGLVPRAGQRIGRLSGGQRKRVSIALELLTRPSLLFLDEPTSGLDPGLERQVMELMRELADGGRTVVVVTHSVQSLDLCDRVLFLARGGRTAYFGPPGPAREFFGSPDLVSVFAALEQRTDVDWHGRFLADPISRRYLPEPAAPAGHAEPPPSPGPAASRQSRRRQAATLTRRYLAVTASDPQNVALLVLQAPLLGLILLQVLPARGFDPSLRGAGGIAIQAVLFLVISASYLGATNAIREIVKEIQVYQRERAVGLSITAYLASKVIVLSVVTVLQAVVLVLLGAARQGGTGHGAVLPALRPELIVDVSLAGLAAMGLGLLVSAAVSRADQALTLLPLLLVPQLVLSSPYFSIDEKVGLRELSYVASAHWAYAGVASTVHLDHLLYLQAREGNHAIPALADGDQASSAVRSAVKAAAGVRPQDRWERTFPAWAGDAAALIALLAAELLGTALALRRRDPGGLRRR